MNFKIGDRVTRNYPVVSSVEGVLGHTVLDGVVVGPPFDYKGTVLVPVDFGHGKPFLCDASELALKGKQ